MALSNYKVSNYEYSNENTEIANREKIATQYPSSISKEIQPWPSKFQKPSDLYRVVVTNSQHPPLMQDRSWSLAVPYKEQKYFHTPSESIANNYTPTANQLKIRNLSQSFKAISKKRDLIKIEDLSSSSDLSLSNNNNNNKKLKTRLNNKNKNVATLFPPSRPISPMEQLETMNQIEKQINKYIGEPSELDLERYEYYIHNGLDKSMIAPLSESQFDVFYGLISLKLKSQPCMKQISESIQNDVIIDYDYSMRKSIVDYVLLNNEERKRIKIDWVPRSFILKYNFIFNTENNLKLKSKITKKLRNY